MEWHLCRRCPVLSLRRFALFPSERYRYRLAEGAFIIRLMKHRAK